LILPTDGHDFELVNPVKTAPPPGPADADLRGARQ
jgi:hypothetical protein